MEEQWIAVIGRGNEEDIERFATRREAIDRIVEDWSHLTPRERRDAHDYVGYITEAYDSTGDIQEIVLDLGRTMDVYFEHEDKLYRVEVPETDDVWTAIGIHDDLNGTDLYDHLDETNVLGVDCGEYPNAETVESWEDVVGRIEEVTATLQLGVSGNSLILRVTDQARMLGVGRGDIVDVTIRRR